MEITQYELNQCHTLISRAKEIIRQEEEIKKLRGESFNVFSVLKMERLENRTHSAFIGELLNPRGSHLLGATFLKLFLELVDFKNEFDLSTATLKLEKGIGERNDELKTGGRVDIYLFDRNNNTICIENKIDAPEQNVQIERYVNHNKSKNIVFYLTKFGKPAEGNLNDKEDYFGLSYNQDILRWLELCLKESTEQPILRESIRQYIILVKKITGQLNDKAMSNQFNQVISDHYLIAKQITFNLPSVERDAVIKFLTEIKNELGKTLTGDWTIHFDESVANSEGGISISQTSWNGITIQLVSDKSITYATTEYGINVPHELSNREFIYNKLKTVKDFNKWESNDIWPLYRTVLDFSTDEKRAVLFDAVRRAELVGTVSKNLLMLAQFCKEVLAEINNK